MRPRFSLRWMFLATALFAVLCYGLIYPTIVANRFVRAVAAKEYNLADSYFRKPDDRFMVDWNEYRWHFKVQAALEPRTFHQLLRGERVILLTVMYSDAGPIRRMTYKVVAARRGLLTPQIHSFSDGSGEITLFNLAGVPRQS